MLTSFFRTALLLFFVVASLRMMGKRQIGELQPVELVITILLSQIAATPMQDNDFPVLHTLVCLFTLTGTELLLSVLSLKSLRVRRLMDGGSVTLVRGGRIDQRAMKRLRLTVDDLLEGLRQKDVFDISQVHTVIAETNGSFSVLLRAEAQPANTGLMRKKPPEPGPPQVLAADGRLNPAGIAAAGLCEGDVYEILKKEKASPENTFLLTVDGLGSVHFVRKEAGV